ncbi:MAG: DUF1539 domain-containing protein [Verrucomicrobia bacterium]|nr:DUF1539 domain-containing protein [Verrucomicrobiota bacterium]
MKCSNDSATTRWITASLALVCGSAPWILPARFTPRYFTGPMKVGVTCLTAAVAYSQLVAYLSPGSRGWEKGQEDIKAFCAKKEINEETINKLPKRIAGVLPDVVGHPAYRELSLILRDFAQSQSELSELIEDARYSEQNINKLINEINKYLDSILNPSASLPAKPVSDSDYLGEELREEFLKQLSNPPPQENKEIQEERKKIVKQLILLFRDPNNNNKIKIFFELIDKALEQNLPIAQALEAAILELKNDGELPPLPTRPPELKGEKGLAAAYVTHVGATVCEDLVTYFQENHIEISREEARLILLSQLKINVLNERIQGFASTLKNNCKIAKQFIQKQREAILSELGLKNEVDIQEVVDYIFCVRDVYPQCVKEYPEKKESIDFLREQLQSKNTYNYSALLHVVRIEQQIEALTQGKNSLESAIERCEVGRVDNGKKVLSNLRHILVKLEDPNLPSATKQHILTDLADKLSACDPTWVEVSRYSLEEIYSCAEKGEDILLRMAKKVREDIVLKISGGIQWHTLNYLRGQSDLDFGLDKEDIEGDRYKNNFKISESLSSFRQKCMAEYTPHHLVESVQMQLLYRSGTETNLLQQEVLYPFLEDHPEICKGVDSIEWMTTNCLEKQALGNGKVAHVINLLGVGYMLEAIGLIK